VSLADAFHARGRELMHRDTSPTATVATRTLAPERRDPKAATQIVGRWQSPTQPMIPEWNAEDAIRWAYCANVVAYRCLQILASDIAGATFRAGDRPPSEPGGKAKDNPDARLAQLLGPPPGGPAPKLTARRLWAWTVVQRKVTGRHGWEIEAAAQTKEITALWPLVSAHIYPYPSAGGTEWFRAFDYGTGDQAKPLSPDQIMYGWDPSPSDFRQPMSCFQAARLDLTIVNLMDRYNIGFLRNDARPAALVVTEAFASDNDFQAFKGNWRGEYGGPDNAGKTAFAEVPEPEDGGERIKPSEAVYVKELGLSQSDASFVEQHRESLSRVAMVIGVPWSRLDSSGRTFDNAGHEDRNYWLDTVVPLTRELADEVNMQLAPRLGKEVGWFDLSHVKALQPEPKVQAVGVPALVTGLIAQLNEGRHLVGLDPVEGGDRFLTLEEVAALTGRHTFDMTGVSMPTPDLGEVIAPTTSAVTAENTTLDTPAPEVRAIPAAPPAPPLEQRDHRGETSEQASAPSRHAGRRRWCASSTGRRRPPSPASKATAAAESSRAAPPPTTSSPKLSGLTRPGTPPSPSTSSSSPHRPRTSPTGSASASTSPTHGRRRSSSSEPTSSPAR
jgi:HK97 family phage portal protein